jgi:hypothetical protein
MFYSSVFIYWYKIHPPYTPSFSLSLCPPLPLVPTPGEDLFFLFALHFLKIKCILIVQGDFSLVLPVCTYHAFSKLIPFSPLLTHSLSPCSPNIHQFAVQCIILYSYIDGLLQYFSFTNIYFLPPLVPPQTILFCHYVMCVRMFLHIHLTYRSSFHMKENVISLNCHLEENRWILKSSC